MHEDGASHASDRCDMTQASRQAQDRCHRIGQTREVHIYRLVSERTIEENILAKSDQKRQLDHLAIQSGGFNTDFLSKFNPRELLGMQGATSAHCTPGSRRQSKAPDLDLAGPVNIK